MFRRLGVFVAHRSRLVLAMSLLTVIVTAVLGVQVIPALSSGGYEDPGSDSSAAAEYLVDHFGVSDPWTIIVLDSDTSADAPAAVAAASLVARTAAAVPGVERVTSYWSLGSPPQLRSTDGKAAYLFVYTESTELEPANATSADVEAAVQDLRLPTGIEAHFAGTGPIMNGVNGQVKQDMTFAETIAIPISALLTVLVFGSLVASLTPYVVALLAIPGALFVLWIADMFTDVSVFGLNLLTGLGLGLGIDYALLVVNRFREELATGADARAAVVRTVETAGRTVVYSGTAVALTLAAMQIFPQYFLKTFAWAGVSVVLLAVVGAIVPLPALLALLGHRVDAGRLFARFVHAPSDGGMWARVARFTMRRPWPVVVGASALLLTLAAPVLGLNTGQVDERVLPASHPVAESGALVRERFAGRESQPLEVILPGAAAKTAAVAAYAADLSRLDRVVRVITPAAVVVDGTAVAPNPAGGTFTNGRDARVNVVLDVDARTPAAMDVTDAVRAVAAPVDGVLVGGAAAIYTDSQRGVSDYFPWAVLWIAIATLIVLFLFTGSVLLPLKAVVLNVASLSATFGVLTWIFQDGHLAGWFGDFQLTGTLDTSTLVLIGVVVFGLSMDYELFLLSRIAELHEQGADTENAVALGLQRSGRIITAAALILAAVFIAFVSGDVKSVKLIGVGVAFAILLDASIVRGLLVPALMRIAGRWNWWAPRPLAAIHARFGLREQ